MGVTKVDTDAQRAPMINQLFTMPLFEGSRALRGDCCLCTQASAGEAKFNVEEECSLPASALWENMGIRNHILRVATLQNVQMLSLSD